MYDPRSLKAEEFINHDEILATLAYADEKKNDWKNIPEITALVAEVEEKLGVSVYQPSKT